MLRRRALQLLGQGLRAAARPSKSSAVEGLAAKGGPYADFPSWQQVRRQWTDRRGYEHFDGRGRLASGDYRGRRSQVVLTIAGVGCFVVWSLSREEVPYTGRKHAILVSCGMEKELGREAFNQVLMEARMEGALLPPYHPAVRAVTGVGNRIARAAEDGYGGGFQKHLQGLQWEFAVIRSDQVNAFCVPGGKVVVYTGLLKMMRTEDELAAVLAHEVAHVIARHGAERMSQAQFLHLGQLLMYWLYGIALPQGLLTAAFFLPNSRKAETEADVIGVQVAARACYDPAAAVTVFEKLEAVEKAHGGTVPKFLRTHPLSSDRIKAIQEMLGHADYLYHTSGCDAARGPLQGFRGALARVASWGT